MQQCILVCFFCRNGLPIGGRKEGKAAIEVIDAAMTAVVRPTSGRMVDTTNFTWVPSNRPPHKDTEQQAAARALALSRVGRNAPAWAVDLANRQENPGRLTQACCLPPPPMPSHAFQGLELVFAHFVLDKTLFPDDVCDDLREMPICKACFNKYTKPSCCGLLAPANLAVMLRKAATRQETGCGRRGGEVVGSEGSRRSFSAGRTIPRSLDGQFYVHSRIRGERYARS